MSSSGLPSSTIRSARLPGSIEPISRVQPEQARGADAAGDQRLVGRTSPLLTMSWYSSGFSPFFIRLGAPQSQPMAILTPIRRAILSSRDGACMIGSARSQRQVRRSA